MSSDVVWSMPDPTGRARLEWRKDMALRWASEGRKDVFIPIGRDEESLLGQIINSFLYDNPDELQPIATMIHLNEQKDIPPVCFMLVIEGGRPWIKLYRDVDVWDVFELTYPEASLQDLNDRPPLTNRLMKLRAEQRLEYFKKTIHETIYASPTTAMV